MFGIEEDNKPLLHRINKDAEEIQLLTIKVADLEKLLQGQGTPLDRQKILLEIQDLKRRLQEKDLEIMDFKKQPPSLVAELAPPSIHPPRQPITDFPTYSTAYYNSQPEKPGYGYRGGGSGPLLNPDSGSTSHLMGPKPYGNSSVNAGPQYPGANTSHNASEYVAAISSPASIDQNMRGKMCPVHKAQGRDVLMTPATLYGTRVDINENGIWFDKGELQGIVSKLKRSDWTDLAAKVKLWQRPKTDITTQREKLVEFRKQYDEQYQRYLLLHSIVQSGGPDKEKSVGEYRTLTQNLKVIEGEIKKGIDITPGKTIPIIPVKQPGRAAAAPGHTDLKFCPVEMARGQKIIMARVKIFGEDIDASRHGLWFDEGELVSILKKVQAKDTGIMAKVKSILRGEGIKGALGKQVDARIAKVKERDEAHEKILENQKMQQFGKDYDDLEERYNRLSRELDSSVDITPGWLDR